MLMDKKADYISKTTFPDLAAIALGDFAKNCIQSHYISSGAYKEGAATTEWLTGATKLPVSSTTTSANKALAYKFIAIVRKAAKTVGFAQKGKHLVAWYCTAPKPALSGQQDPSNYIKATTGCLKNPGANSLWNSCFNTAAIKEVNVYRAQHKVLAFSGINLATDATVKANQLKAAG